MFGLYEICAAEQGIVFRVLSLKRTITIWRLSEQSAFLDRKTLK